MQWRVAVRQKIVEVFDVKTQSDLWRVAVLEVYKDSCLEVEAQSDDSGRQLVRLKFQMILEDSSCST